MSNEAEKIAELNDAWRKSGPMMIESGLHESGADFVQRAMQAIREYDDFDPDTDPYGERDFGSFDLDGQKILWKIDYYAKPVAGEKHSDQRSEDPADTSKTDRITTLMLAEEY